MPAMIRPEQAKDIEKIHAIESAAFARREEADLVDRLRDEAALWLSHVAVESDEIVGHAAYSMVSVRDTAGECSYPALGPIAVAPTRQRRGIGKALIQAGIFAVREAGFGLLFLVGHPEYYPRFGFQPALPLGFSSDYVKKDGPHAHFMVCVLDEKLLGAVRGRVRYHSAFTGL